ncbi:CBN-MDT-1.2 protein [Caenorhabditis brenneri]|uniref:CBN-MDT-1.2 protein n=1 Tax=Caenorhabditis brenneri TaxID=135651 RepID=G0MIH7_CAEBE|nr:CBN-MDT-1.2 protein [Caenorhabditis brenneri]
MSNIQLLERPRRKELNLEHLDQEMRMEQVRQSASKMDWASFGLAVRKNLLEKRNTIDADGRRDVLNGIAFMKTRLPIDNTVPIEERVQILADSLRCEHMKTKTGWKFNREGEILMELITDAADQVSKVNIGLWNNPVSLSPQATELLQNEKWTELRDCIADNLSKYDSELSSFYLKPKDLRQGRLYYMVDPIFRSMCAKDSTYSLSKENYEHLPYFEFAFVNHDSTCTLPEYDEEGKWSETVEINAAICLKFSKGIIISESTRKKLAKFCARNVTIRHYTNCYRYLAGDLPIQENLQLITQFTDGNAQQWYSINPYSFSNEGDCVISEIYLKRLQDFHLVIEILRNEAMHMSFWESMLAACHEKRGSVERVVRAIKVNISIFRDKISIALKTKQAPILVRITDSRTLEAKVEVFNVETGLPLSPKVDEILSRKLNETWSIPIMLTHFVSGDDFKLEKVHVPLRAGDRKETLAQPYRGF